MRCDFNSNRHSSSSGAPPQSSWQDDETEQASMLFGVEGGGGVRGFDDGGFRLEKKSPKRLCSRPEAPQAASGDAGNRDREWSTMKRCRRGFRHQQHAVNGRRGLDGEVKAGAFRGRGERIRWSASSEQSCGEYGGATAGGAGGGRRRWPWLSPRTQQQPLHHPHHHHHQQVGSFAGCVGSGSGRRCTAVLMSAASSKGDGGEGGVDWSAGAGTEPTAGGVAEGGETTKLREGKGTHGKKNDDNTAFTMMPAPVGEQALPPPPPGTAAAANTEQRLSNTAQEPARQRTGIAVATVQQQRTAGAHAATPTSARSPEQDDASSGINGFGLEKGDGEFAETEAIDPIAESYERGRWLLGLLVLQSTSSFVLDKYQVRV